MTTDERLEGVFRAIYSSGTQASGKTFKLAIEIIEKVLNSDKQRLEIVIQPWDEMESLREESTRLREALERIRDRKVTTHSFNTLADVMSDLAREALLQTKETK